MRKDKYFLTNIYPTCLFFSQFLKIVNKFKVTKIVQAVVKNRLGLLIIHVHSYAKVCWIDGCQRFRPFSDLTPEVSALFHFGPGGFGPQILKCRILLSFFLLFVLSLFPNNFWSKSRTSTAIKQGTQLLDEPSLTFNFLFLLHSIFQFDLSQLFV